MFSIHPLEMTRAISALKRLRVVRVGLLEHALVDMMEQALLHEGLLIKREVMLVPGSRIDITVDCADGGVVGIEAKRGRPIAASAGAQVERYARSGTLRGIVFVAERSFDLPSEIGGIPVAAVSLQASMGIAL